MHKKIIVGLYFQSLSRKGGGAEKNIIWLSNELTKKNFEVHLISWDRLDNKSFYSLSNKVKWHKMNGNNFKLNKIQKLIRLNSLFKKNKINLLIGFVMSGDGTLFLSSILNKVKIICAERNEPSMYEILYSPIRKKINFTMMQLATYIIIQQEIFKKYYPKTLQKKILTIPNPVFKEKNINNICQVLEKEKILFVGRLERKQKRPMLLLKAFNEIKNKIPNWTLDFVGDGEEKSIMEDFIKKNDLMTKVKIFNTNKNINNFYKNSSIFITTSLWEGFPNSLTEAMHHGLACIGSNDSIAIKNLLDKDCGWLIYNFEENSFGQEIIKCIINKDERLEKGINARNKINEYRTEKIFKLWENLILSFE